jgi:hypothetical protein
MEKVMGNLANFLKCLAKIEFIRAWNVAGAFVKPKGMIRNSKCPKISFESSFVYVSCLHSDLMISTSEVKFCKYGCSMQFIQEVFNH